RARDEEFDGRVLSDQAASALRLRDRQRPQDEGARPRRGRHRPRDGQSRPRDAQAHRREADRGRPESEEPSLLGLPRHHAAARREETAKLAWPKAKLLILSFPHNPTTLCVDRGFFEKVVAFAREHRLMVVHDFAYADFAFDGYRPPSFLEVPGAKEVGVELFSTSKSYNMPGWRLGFVCGNA